MILLYEKGEFKKIQENGEASETLVKNCINALFVYFSVRNDLLFGADKRSEKIARAIKQMDEAFGLKG